MNTTSIKQHVEQKHPHRFVDLPALKPVIQQAPAYDFNLDEGIIEPGCDCIEDAEAALQMARLTAAILWGMVAFMGFYAYLSHAGLLSR